MKKYLLPVSLALALVACGGGGGNDGNSSAASAPVAVDAFTLLVQSQYMGQSDTDDVTLIDTVSATSPENSEPIAI